MQPYLNGSEFGICFCEGELAQRKSVVCNRRTIFEDEYVGVVFVEILFELFFDVLEVAYGIPERQFLVDSFLEESQELLQTLAALRRGMNKQVMSEAP